MVWDWRGFGSHSFQLGSVVRGLVTKDEDYGWIYCNYALFAVAAKKNSQALLQRWISDWNYGLPNPQPYIMRLSCDASKSSCHARELSQLASYTNLLQISVIYQNQPFFYTLKEVVSVTTRQLKLFTEIHFFHIITRRKIKKAVRFFQEIIYATRTSNFIRRLLCEFHS